MLRLLSALLALSSPALLAGCSADGGTPRGGPGSSCVSTSDCRTELVCVDGTCADRPDAGGGTGEDSGIACLPSRTCGDTCCAEGETCGGGRCCAAADLCGGLCCGADQTCEADRCVLDCTSEETPCGTGTDAVCCGAGDVCYLGECITPGDPCTSTRDCPDGEYCEATVMRCLPRVTGGETCEYHPPVGELELTEEWSWTGSTVLPANDQVMMAPMVANLTDDNGDGAIDENDVPEVVFTTFSTNNYWETGVLRAISGDDGSDVWPTGEPGYRLTPGGEIAIAELDSTSPGPEIVACSASNRTARTPGYMVIIRADGTLLRRFDTSPNDVPCGFDAPSIGDMDGDGVPEILLRYVIAHADGTVVRRIRDLRGASYVYTALADLDGDMDLEVVGGNAAYEMDGTPLWDRSADVADGWVAVADLDLDGSPEVVTVAGGDHSIRALDGATGADVWGPTDINPPELASVIAADSKGPVGGGPPTIANFDDDPEPEIAFAGGFAYVIFEHDGSRKWWYETIDRSSRSTGSSIFDFEGDGLAEVLYNDERVFRVFRGPDGTLMHDECNTSGTLHEYPIVVDVDNDDHAEIVVMENDYAFSCLDGSPSGTGIHAFGHPRNEWVRTRRIWNQHTYHVTNIEEDGTVPRREEANWTVDGLNNFRQNVQPEGLFDAPDLVLADLYASTASCPTSMVLSVRVVNRGTAGAPAGIPVTFYDTTGGGRTLLGRVSTTRALLPGESEVVTLDPPFAIPSGMESAVFSFEAVVNDADDMPVESFHECRDDNNGIATEATCPIVE